jgi:hypothetical protein
MRPISSRMTFFYKRVFPLLWFGFLTLVVSIPIVSGAGRNASLPIPFFIVPAIMAVFGYFIMKKLVFDLVDEVWDDGDSLLIKNRGKQQRVALSDIKNVSYSPYINPPRVTLSLRKPTIFGDQITFGAPMRLVPFSTSPRINDLIERVDRARQRSHSSAQYSARPRKSGDLD